MTVAEKLGSQLLAPHLYDAVLVEDVCQDKDEDREDEQQRDDPQDKRDQDVAGRVGEAPYAHAQQRKYQKQYQSTPCDSVFGRDKIPLAAVKVCHRVEYLRCSIVEAHSLVLTRSRKGLKAGFLERGLHVGLAGVSLPVHLIKREPKCWTN